MGQLDKPKVDQGIDRVMGIGTGGVKGFRAVALACILVLTALAAPAVSASTVHLTLNPKAKTTMVEAVTETTVVLSYPSGSLLSQALNGSNYSLKASSTYSKGSPDASAIQSALTAQGVNLSVREVNITLNVESTGNSTSFTLKKYVTVSALVYGAYNVSAGKVKADLAWKSFDLKDKLLISVNGEELDVNLMGSMFGTLFGNHPLADGALFTMFGDSYAWHASALNFSSLSSPLNTWARSYDPSTGTTTFSKTVNKTIVFSASYSSGSANYSFKVSYDPSSTITVPGYATASGNTLFIASTAPSNLGLELAAAIVVVVIVASAAVVAYTRRK